jgi:hypothetical protein
MSASAVPKIFGCTIEVDGKKKIFEISLLPRIK